MDIAEFKVDKAPPLVHYIPGFIDEEEEEFLLRKVLDAPKPKWDYLKNRRLQNWGGIIGKKGSLISDDIPEWLLMYTGKIAEIPNLFPDGNKPNHVLVNEYLPGQGIMPHTDGPAFFPIVTTLTLGSHALLDFYNPLHVVSESGEANLESRKIGCLLLEPRSLVIIREDMYRDKLHGIAERSQDTIRAAEVFNLDKTSAKDGEVLERDTRISLTIRNVPKVSRNSVLSLLGKP